jgi:hypothetical protein
MQGEGKPKSQTEKCEVSGFLDAILPAGWVLAWQFLLTGCQKRESLFPVLVE